MGNESEGKGWRRNIWGTRVREKDREEIYGELGVRVQTGGMTSDPTAKHAIRNVMTRDALINCDFSGDVLDGVDHPEAYMKDSSVDEDDNEPV